MAGFLGRLRTMTSLGRCSAEFQPLRATVTPRPALGSQLRLVTRASGAPATPKVKAPLNAYQLFQKDPVVKGNFASQKLTLPEMSKKMSELWKSMAASEKQKYLDEQKVLKQQYDSAAGIVLKKPNNKPLAGYSLYVKDHFKEVKSRSSSASTTEVMKLIAKQWNGLSESEKAKYKAK